MEPNLSHIIFFYSFFFFFFLQSGVYIQLKGIDFSLAPHVLRGKRGLEAGEDLYKRRKKGGKADNTGFSAGLARLLRSA